MAKHYENDGLADRQYEIKAQADKLQGAVNSAGFDEPTKEQVNTLLSNSMRSLFLSQDNHDAGRYKTAHSHLKVAAQHVGTAARMLQGTPAESAAYMGPKHSSGYQETVADYVHGQAKAYKDEDYGWEF